MYGMTFGIVSISRYNCNNKKSGKQVASGTNCTKWIKNSQTQKTNKGVSYVTNWLNGYIYALRTLTYWSEYAIKLMHMVKCVTFPN